MQESNRENYPEGEDERGFAGDDLDKDSLSTDESSALRVRIFSTLDYVKAGLNPNGRYPELQELSARVDDLDMTIEAIPADVARKEAEAIIDQLLDMGADFSSMMGDDEDLTSQDMEKN